jgi:hypothetical protein
VAESAKTEVDLDAVAPARAVRASVRGLASVVAPASLVTALLYYFGWARTYAQAQALGLDESLFGFSTRDYVLRSISAMFFPLFVGASATLAGLLAHAGIVSWVSGDIKGSHEQIASVRKRRLDVLRLIAVALTGAGSVSLILGLWGARVAQPSRFVSLFSPLGVTVSIVLIGYAAYLNRRFLVKHVQGHMLAEFAGLSVFAWSLLTVLLLLSLFWTVSHYAGVRGVDLARRVDQSLPGQATVTLYSAKRLGLQPPVKESALAGNDLAYRYVYTGLKLLFRSEHKYFLRPSDTSYPTNIVIPESDDVRLEFSRGG